MDLTVSDLNVLLDAVELWEKESKSVELMGDLMGAMLSRDEEQFQKMQRDRERRALQKEAEHRTRKEQGVVLRAKLITMREQLGAQEPTKSFHDQLADNILSHFPEQPKL